MSIVTTTRATERLSRRLRRAGLPLWIGRSSGDAAGRYLVFRVGGSCVAVAGWTLAEAEEWVAEHILAARAAEEEARVATEPFAVVHAPAIIIPRLHCRQA